MSKKQLKDKSISNILIMSKQKDLVSQSNISMPKKSNYDKALDYYGLAGKSARQVAANLNYQPKTTLKVKRTGVTRQVNMPVNSPNYSNRVEEYIVRKWKEDTQIYSATYKMFFRIREKGKTKLQERSQNLIVKGTKKDLASLAFLEMEYRREKFGRESDADVDSFALGEEPVSEPIPIQAGKGVSVDNGKVVSTKSGGMRKVGMKGHKAGLKMKDRFALKFSDGENEWDRGEGTCVFDYLIWKYKDVSGFPKKFNSVEGDPYKYLDSLLRIDETEKPLQEGVSVYALENFCDEFCLSMYAYDKTDSLIEYYKPAKVASGGTRKPLIFTCFDNHFEPVEEKKQRDKKVKKATSSGEINWTSNEIEKTFDKKEEVEKPKTKRQVIAPTEEEYDAYREIVKDKKIQLNNHIAIEYLKKNNFQVPFPLDEKSLYIEDGSIKKMTYDDKIVLTEPIDERVKNYYRENYAGQTYINIMNEIWERDYGCKFSDAPFMSKINGDIATALNAEKVKWRTHLGMTPEGVAMGLDTEKIREMIVYNKAIAVDICKCYSDCLYSPRERWLVFSGKEILEVYDKKPLSLGLYFVITDDMTLFHQSNWYSKQIITKARQEGIKFIITHQIRCVDDKWEKEVMKEVDEGAEIRKVGNLYYTGASGNLIGYNMKNDETLFRTYADRVIEETEIDEDFTLAKLIINSITGMLGKTIYTTKNVSIGKSLNEVWEDWVIPQVQETPDADLFVSPVNPDDKENTIYMYGFNSKSVKTTNGLPMYIQILDWSNMALYDLAKDVGGTCVYRKTDMIVSVGGVIPENKMIKQPCYYEETFGKYREENDGEKLHYDFEMNMFRSVECPKVADDWKYWDFNDSNDWKFIIEKAIENGGMMVSGRAGTGKSYIVEQGIKSGLLPADAKSRLAFTNRAARNIGGTTIHKALGINSKNKLNDACITGAGNAAKVKINDKEYKIFIVDEISMINCDLWNKLLMLKKKTDAIFILLGDYRQCPPIEEGEYVNYFNHSYPKLLTNSNSCELTIPKRYDMELWNWLEKFYEEGIDGDAISKKKVEIDNILYRRNICFYNDTRKYINELCMKAKTMFKTKWLILEVPEKCKNAQAQKTWLYEGLPIMAVVNSQELEIVNSDELVVKDFDPNANTMEIEGISTDVKLTIDFKEFHKLFCVNYAATTHKSQGATIEDDINIFDWDKLSNDRKLGYTAVSRGKKCGQVSIVENYYEYQFKFNREDVIDDEED